MSMLDDWHAPMTGWRSAFRVSGLALLCWLLCGVLGLGPSAWAASSAGQDPVCEPRILRVQVAQAPDGLLPREGWQDVRLPDYWRERWPGYDGVAWYRIDWLRGCDDKQLPASPVALGIGWMSVAGQVYINHDLLWRDHQLAEPYSRSWNTPRAWRLTESSLNPSFNTLWVAVHGVDAMGPGLGAVHLGHPAAIEAWHDSHRWHQRTMMIINLTISSVLGCLFFCIWLMSRTQTAAGWYVLTTLFWVVFASTLLVTEPAAFFTTTVFLRVSMASGLLFFGSYCLFIWRFCRLGGRRYTLSLLALYGGMALLVLCLPLASMRQLLPWLLLISVLVFLVNNLVLLAHGLRCRDAEALVLSVSGLLCLLIGVHDYVVLARQLDSNTLLAYTSLLTLLAISVLLGRRIARNMRRIAQFNQELSQSVTRACDELGATLAREHALALDNSLLQERLQIAQDLHDSLGGSLVRAIAMVEQTRDPIDNARFLSMLKLLRNDLRQVIDSGAHIGVVGAGTPQALMAPLRHRFVNLFDELGVWSNWDMPAEWCVPPGARVCLALTRFVEEALANVIKHSRATQVDIRLSLPKENLLVLRIEDNGIGFDVAAVQRAGLSVGMRSMHVRMERIGGRLTVRSRRGATVLEAWLRLAVTTTAEAQDNSALHTGRAVPHVHHQD